MYDTTIATKLIDQLKKFLGRISPHFHKPVARFIGDMMYGIMAEKDVKLSSVVRALKEGITPKKVEDRLSRMLSSKGLERGLHDALAEETKGSIAADGVADVHFRLPERVLRYACIVSAGMKSTSRASKSTRSTRTLSLSPTFHVLPLASRHSRKASKRT